MPVISLSLSTLGPLVNVGLAPSLPYRAALISQNKPLPPPTQGMFLLDTGASHSSVDPSFLRPLGLLPTGAIMTHTPSTAGVPVSCPTYDVSLIIPSQRMGERPLIIEAISVSEAHFQAQGIAGLIGRDVLGLCLLNYNGPEGRFTLAY